MLFLFSLFATGEVSSSTSDLVPSDVVATILDECKSLYKEKAFADVALKADEALAIAIYQSDPIGEAISHEYRARALQGLARDDEAVSEWGAAITIWKLVGDGPRQIRAYSYQAALVTESDRSTATAFLDSAIAVAERETLRTTAAAVNLREAGLRAMRRQQLDAAEILTRSALDLNERIAPDSLEFAKCLHNLGAFSAYKNDLPEAKDYYEQALLIKERLAPDSKTLANTLNNLGVVARQQGDLGTARYYFERALVIKESLGPQSPSVASTLNNLGIVAYQQRDYTASEQYLEQALQIKEEHMPGSLSYAHTLVNLGILASLQKQFTLARDYLERSLQVKTDHPTNTLDFAVSLINLASVAKQQNDLAAAEGYYEQSLAIAQDLAAEGTLVVASCLVGLGTIAHEKEDYETAQKYLDRALAIQRSHAPHSFAVARTLWNLGQLAEASGSLHGAAQHYEEGWRIVRDQWRSVVGDESIQNFGEGYIGHVDKLVELQLELGRPLAAYNTIEQSRALGLLWLLADRGFCVEVAEQDIWKPLRKAEEHMQLAGEELSRARSAENTLRQQLSELESADRTSDAVAAKRKEYNEAIATSEESLASYTVARIEYQRELRVRRQAIPGLEPMPITEESILQALPSHSLFLAFFVGEESTQLFALSATGKPQIENYTVAVTEDELTEIVANILRIIQDGADESIAFSDRINSFREASRTLFRFLFPPELRHFLAEADRVVISPDGPLWRLPFAALLTDAEDELSYLGLRKPLSYAQSLSVLTADRERHNRSLVGGPVLVVGDPLFDRSSSKSPADDNPSAASIRDSSGSVPGLRSSLYDGQEPPVRLLGSLKEAKRVANFYGCEAMLGELATEAAVRDRLAFAPVAHLATHGYFHPYRAMSSGILLTPPDPLIGDGNPGDDGALQAWEFIGGLRMEAELVVLSACETGRGDVVRGEGLVGLTRALQVAGASSVVATHWKVADNTAPEMMTKFHDVLVQGAAKDEALRQAMEDAVDRGLADPLGNQSRSHPFYWAGFFLTGDPSGTLSFSTH